MNAHDAGLARQLEEFQQTEELRLALEQPQYARTGTATALQQASQSAAATQADVEDLAMAVGLPPDHELFASFASQLHLVSDSDDEGDVEPKPHKRAERNPENARAEARQNSRSNGFGQPAGLRSALPRPPQQQGQRTSELVSPSGESLEEPEPPADHGERIESLQALLQCVLEYLDEDSLDQCKVCNRAWRDSLLSESLWRAFCMRTFVVPAFRPVRCHLRDGVELPRRFGTWLRTRRARPHVRVETGLYIMKSTYIKARPERSMWDTAYTPFCEVNHYRYMLFRATGEVLYASTPLPLAEMRAKFQRLLFQDYVAEGSCHRDPAESGSTGTSSSTSVVGGGGRRRRKGPDQRKLDTTKADTIYRGVYTVVGDRLSVVLNMVKFSVTFQMEIVTRGGSFDRLHVVRHQSIYHRTNERVVTYKLASNYFERIFDYYAFSFPFDP